MSGGPLGLLRAARGGQGVRGMDRLEREGGEGALGAVDAQRHEGRLDVDLARGARWSGCCDFGREHGRLLGSLARVPTRIPYCMWECNKFSTG